MVDAVSQSMCMPLVLNHKQTRHASVSPSQNYLWTCIGRDIAMESLHLRQGAPGPHKQPMQDPQPCVRGPALH